MLIFMTLDRIRTQKERQRLPDLTGEYKQEYESRHPEIWSQPEKGRMGGEKERKNIEINSDIKTLFFSKPTNKYLCQRENDHSFMGEKFNSAAITGYIHDC